MIFILGVSGSNSATFAAPPCSCPDGTVLHDGDTVSFPAADGATRAVGKLVYLNGCGDGTYRYYRYSMTSDFKLRKMSWSQNYTLHDACSFFKPFSLKKIKPVHHVSTVPDAQNDHTISSLDGIGDVSGPMPEGFQVNQYVVANRDIKLCKHTVKRGTPGQVHGLAGENNQQLSVVFFTRPKIRKLEKAAAVTGIIAGTAAVIWKDPGAGVVSIVGAAGASIAWAAIRPMRPVRCNVDPDDIQLVN